MNSTVDAPDTYPTTILVVDDDADMRFLARSVLEGSGIEVAGEAADGPEALAKLGELDPPPVPTVVLLDNQMPGLSGLEVAEQILRDRPEQLIVLFSAYLDERDHRASHRPRRRELRVQGRRDGPPPDHQRRRRANHR